MDNRQLQFIGNFNKVNSFGRLAIKKDVPITLTPWIKEYFDKRDGRESLLLDEPFQKYRIWNESEKYHEVEFYLNEFIEAFLGTYSSEKIVPFLKSHLIEENSFDNEAVINQINLFEKEYKVIKFSFAEREKGSFMLLPKQNISVEELESKINIGEKATGREINYDHQNYISNNIPVTKPYRRNKLPQIIKTLREDSKIVFPYVCNWNCTELNHFSLINKYNLPTDHLKITTK